MISKFRSPIPRSPALEAAIEKMATLQSFRLAEIVRCDLDREFTKLIRRSQAERAERDRRRDLVPYAEVLQEFGLEIANKEARPPLEHRQRVDAAVAKLLDSVGYQHEAGRPA